MKRPLITPGEPAHASASVHGLDRMTGVYTCPELTHQPARAEANNALQHPSRIGDRLRWPDGRLTDLNGVPIPTFVNAA